jgi:phosphoribosylaminoimidazole-succinocarboxamide synthase
MAARLPAPIFTPATKAEVGDHDENVSFEQAAANCNSALATALAGTGKTGAQLCAEARDAAIRLYEEASAYAATRGIIIADTKFEFGIDAAGTLHLIDEALTPDSSRFWPADQYAEGSNPPSYDKQYVRDYLETLDWGKKAPPDRSCRPMSSPGPAPSTSKPTKTDRPDLVSWRHEPGAPGAVERRQHLGRVPL